MPVRRERRCASMEAGPCCPKVDADSEPTGAPPHPTAPPMCCSPALTASPVPFGSWNFFLRRRGGVQAEAHTESRLLSFWVLQHSSMHQAANYVSVQMLARRWPAGRLPAKHMGATVPATSLGPAASGTVVLLYRTHLYSTMRAGTLRLKRP